MKSTYTTLKIKTDFTTGELTEVINTYILTSFAPPADSYEQLATAQKPVKLPWSPEHAKDTLRLLGAANNAHFEVQEPTANNAIPLPVKRVTRPKKVTINNIAMHVSLADVEERADNGQPIQNWVEDYVMGACYTVAKANNGKLNVSPRHIFAAVKMNVISTETVGAAFRNSKGEPLGKTQVALIGQCTRFALNGMQMYLDRNPDLYEALQTEVDFITAYYEQEQAIAA